MSILRYIDGITDNSKLTRVLKHLRVCDGYKDSSESITHAVHGLTKKVLMLYVGRLPFFTKKEDGVIKLTLGIKLHQVKEIRDSFFTCKNGKELIFTFCHHYGSRVTFKAFKALVLDSEDIIGCNVKQGTYNETKKIYRYYEIYLNKHL